MEPPLYTDTRNLECFYFVRLFACVNQLPTYRSICASSSYGQSQLAMDRSLVLNMLTLKYKCSGRDAQKPSAKDNRFADDDDDDVPSDVYDYLVRHGLIRQRICNGRNDRFH